MLTWVRRAPGRYWHGLHSLERREGGEGGWYWFFPHPMNPERMTAMRGPYRTLAEAKRAAEEE